MYHLQYSYIEKPTTLHVSRFLRALADCGVSISHLGKSDPPRKFRGSIDEAVSMVLSGKDLTDWTFARDVAQRLDFDFQVHRDPEWTYSTVSASCPDLAAFDLFITIRGVSSGGKDQPCEVVHVTEKCPHELRSRFAVA
jgi:hypothetical protein